MNVAWTLREAGPEDAEGLRNCMVSAYAAYRERMGGARLPPMDVDYRAEIEGYPTWVVTAGGVVLGGLIMVFENDRASIANIAVRPQYQGLGIGGELMRFAESQARERDLAELRLATHVLLEENLSLYRHLGWRETGRDGTRVFMSKEL